jgi:SAM-dependent methyltransferase
MVDRDVRDVVAHQYGATTARLDARLALHQRFSLTPIPWPQWVYDQVSLRGGELVLELGAGTGVLWEHNRDRLPEGVRLLLTDTSPAMCAALRTLQVPVRGVVRADAAAVPLPDASVDVVIANHMLYHVPSPDVALAEMARVLRPDGRAYAATNGRAHMRELEELAASVGVDYAAMRLHLPFSLDDAIGRMSRHFSSVELVRFDDALDVTEPDAIVGYLESVLALSDEQRERMADIVSARIRRDGSFRITKDAGLLHAQLGRQPS